jgi:nitrogen regulatory protein PII-like uncharacterized protein
LLDEINQVVAAAGHVHFPTDINLLLDAMRKTITQRGLGDAINLVRKIEIEGFMAHAVRQINPIECRVIKGEEIAHADKASRSSSRRSKRAIDSD